MNLRKISLIMMLCFFSSNLIYSMEDCTDETFHCLSGIPAQPLLEASEPDAEVPDAAMFDAMQDESQDPQSLETRIKHEISNFNLIALGHLLESDEAASVTAKQRQNLCSYALDLKSEISQLLKDGHCLSGETSNIDRIITYLNAFRFLENFKFPKVLFTNQPYHRERNPEMGANTQLNKALTTLIEDEQEALLICCFHMSDYDVAKCIMLKKKHGISVEVITNQEQAGNLAAIKLLIRSGITVLCPKSHRYEMNHHKFIIFKRNILNKCLVWHGSYNPTVYSNVSSWDDATIDDNPTVIQAFMERFQEIKAASTPMTIEIVNKAH